MTLSERRLSDQRHLFDIGDDIAYLNFSTMSLLLHAVRTAGEMAVAQRARAWELTSQDWFSDSERLRASVAQVLGASPEGVALVPAVSYGLAVAARNLPLGPGQNVVVLDQEFPSSFYTWDHATRTAGAELRVAVREPGQSWTDAILGEIDEHTAVVQAPNVQWTNGAWVDLPRLRSASTAVGAALVVDASQSLGAVPLDVAELRPDVVVAVGYKWLLGGYSLGYLYLDEALRDGEALEQNWIARLGSEDFSGLVDYQQAYQPGARRYDVGERSNFALIPMAQAALDQLHVWGIDGIAEALATVTADIVTRVEKLGLTVPSRDDRGPHMLGVELPPGTTERVVAALKERHVFASVRGTSLRISPHLHTTPHDVERLIDALASVG